MTQAAASSPTTRRQPALDDERYVIHRVIEQLGRPAHLYRINAEKLWGGSYRVNIYCKEESDGPVKAVKMTDSFFVTLAGDEITSVPPIVRKY